MSASISRLMILANTVSVMAGVRSVVVAVGNVAALSHRLGEATKNSPCVVPVHAGIGDRLAVFRLHAGHQFLVALLEVGFDHDAEDGTRAGGDLAGHVTADFDLLLVLLAAVGM